MLLDRLAVDDTPAAPEAKARAIHRQIGEAVPVPVYEIACALDIVEIEEKSLGTLEGILITEAERNFGVVAVNRASSPQRRRFSVAHELGHFLCDWHVTTSNGGFQCTRSDMTQPSGDLVHQRQENEANRFAIELLAPETTIARWLRRLPDIDHVLSIHQQMDISKAAAARRYVSLHPKQVAVVFARNGCLTYVERQQEFPFIPLQRGAPLPAVPAVADGATLSDMLEVDPRDWGLQEDGGELACQHLAQEQGHSITLLYLERS